MYPATDSNISIQGSIRMSLEVFDTFMWGNILYLKGSAEGFEFKKFSEELRIDTFLVLYCIVMLAVIKTIRIFINKKLICQNSDI